MRYGAALYQLNFTLENKEKDPAYGVSIHLNLLPGITLDRLQIEGVSNCIS